MVKVGDPLPDVTVHKGDSFPPVPMKMSEITEGKKVPGYVAAEEQLRAKGIEKVLVFCVNDAAVMKAWGVDQKIGGTIVEFLADPLSELTNALDLAMTHPGPAGVFGQSRSKRAAVVYDKDVATIVEISEGPDDPAGDNDPKGPVTYRTKVENILSQL